jgi:DNA-directed RNA polymerase subunit M/transcription elongation factor TFIIS
MTIHATINLVHGTASPTRACHDNSRDIATIKSAVTQITYNKCGDKSVVFVGIRRRTPLTVHYKCFFSFFNENFFAVGDLATTIYI